MSRQSLCNPQRSVQTPTFLYPTCFNQRPDLNTRSVDAYCYTWRVPLSKTREEAQEPRAPKKTFKRRRCENCNRLYTPIREDQRFCQHDGDNCRKEFHRYGSSYGPLKTGLHKAIEKKYADLAKDSERRYKAFMSDMSDQSRRIDRVERGGSNFTIDSIKEAINRLAVEVADVKAQIDEWRGQIKNAKAHDEPSGSLYGEPPKKS